MSELNSSLGPITMSSETQIFFPWMHVDDDRLVEFDDYPDNIYRKAYLLTEGVSCKSWFPEEVIFSMDANEGMVLADSIPNCLRVFIVTDKVKVILDKEIPEEVEFFPVNILDHDKNLVEPNYYIANFLTVVSCVDTERSDYIMGSIDKTKAHHFKHLFLDSSKIPKDTKLFRLGLQKHLILVRQDLANLLKDEGCTGLNFIDIEDYGKAYRPIDRVALARDLLAKGKL